jgi:glycosyltransferase involved in cell wall biosynthesis
LSDFASARHMKPTGLRILFIALAYPDVAEESGLYSELVEALTEMGHDVRVIAPALSAEKTGPRIEGGVLVVRVVTGDLFGVGLFRKGLSNLALPFRYWSSIKPDLKSWQPHWIMVPTPPITLTPLVWVMKSLTKSRSYLILRDIFPQNAVDLGLVSKFGLTHLFFRWLEMWTYRVHDQIGCMSPANIAYVLDKNPSVDPKKLHILANWISADELKQEVDCTSSRATLGLKESDFVCVFGGNLGTPQKPSFLIHVAEALRNEVSIRIIVVGRGTERDTLVAEKKRRNLSNLEVWNRLSRSQFQALLSAADVGLVLLDERFTIPNIPSRLVGYWAASLPVLAATDSATDIWESFIGRFGGGRCVRMGDVAGFVDEIRWLRDNPSLASKMGTMGRSAVAEHFTASTAAEIITCKMGQ